MIVSPFQQPCRWPRPKDKSAIVWHIQETRDQRALARITPSKLDELRARIQQQNHEAVFVLVPIDAGEVGFFCPLQADAWAGRAQPYLPRPLVRFERIAYQCPRQHVSFYWVCMLLEKPPASILCEQCKTSEAAR